MKKQRVLLGLFIILLVCGLWVTAAEPAADSAEQKVKTVDPPRRLPAGSQEDAGDPADRVRRPPQRNVRPASESSPEERTRNRILSQAMMHQELIDELTAIKKIAEEEGAEKTAAALQKMIDKRNQEFQQAVQERERRRTEMQKRIEERMKAREQGTAEGPGQRIRAPQPQRQEQNNQQEQDQ